MKKIYLSEYDNMQVFTEGFKKGDKGFCIDAPPYNEYKKLTVVETVEPSTKYTEDELLNGKSADGTLNVEDFSITAEFITNDGREIYVYFDSEEFEVEYS